jgi:hypothetical protein
MDSTIPSFHPLRLVCTSKHALQVTQKTCAQAIANYDRTLGLYQEALGAFLEARQGVMLQERFDPLVGDTSCQIRVMMLRELMLQEDIEAYVAERLTEIALIRSQLDPNITFRAKSLRLDEFLDGQGLLLRLPEEIHTIALSYILSKARKCCGYDGMEVPNYQPLQRLGFTSGRSEALVKKARKQLAKVSVAYIQAHGALVSEDLRSTLSDVRKDTHHIPSIPFFSLTEVVLQQALQSRTPILLNTRSEHGDLLQAYLPYEGTYQQVGLDAVQGTLAMRVDAKCVEPLASNTELAERLAPYSILDIIRAGAADHPQYPSDNKAVMPFGASNVLFHESRSVAEEVLKHCFILHIYLAIPTR